MSGSGDPGATDPGWRPVLKGAAPLLLLGPWAPSWIMRARADGGLTALRHVFLSLVSSGFLILVVLLFIEPDLGAPSPGEAAAVVALGAYAVGLGIWGARRPLDTSGPEQLAGSYRANFFLAFALIQSALLIAFVLVFLWGELWPYVTCLPFWFIGMMLIGPTRRNLEGKQQQITASGSPLSLVGSLMEGPPQTGRGG